MHLIGGMYKLLDAFIICTVAWMNELANLMHRVKTVTVCWVYCTLITDPVQKKRRVAVETIGWDRRVSVEPLDERRCLAVEPNCAVETRPSPFSALLAMLTGLNGTAATAASTPCPSLFRLMHRLPILLQQNSTRSEINTGMPKRLHHD